jgi:hypothetical protein
MADIVPAAGAGAKEQGHSAFGASSCERIINCPGSVAAHAAAPRPPESVYAAEGHVAHHLLEQLSKGAIDKPTLFKLVGSSIKSEGGLDIKVTDEMVESVILYFDFVLARYNELRALNKPIQIKMLIETKVVATSIDPEAWGTLDTGIVLPGHSLDVIDFKYGQGKVVEATENKQGLQYVVSVMDTLKCEAFDTIRFTIGQPRAHHSDGPIRTWEIPIARIRAFREELKAAIAAARQPNAPRAAGDWCRWCNAKVDCATARQFAQKETGAVFAAAAAAEVVQHMPAVEAMTPEMMARVMEVEDVINEWFAAVRVRAFAMEEAKPGSIPRHKVVIGRSNRKWTDEEKVKEKFEDIYGDSIYKPKELRTPADLEDVVGKKAVADMTFKPEGRRTLAAVSDWRKAALAPGRAEFAHLEVQEAVVVKPGSDEDLMGDL